MGRWTDESLRMRPVYQKGAQNLSDEEALEVKGIYDEWSTLINPDYKNHTVKKGFKFTHANKLYKTEQPEYTFTEEYVPGTVGTESLFSVIDETHAGTLADPIPYNGNMALEEGKYYEQDGVVYLCIRDTGNPVYHALANLVGIYVEEVSA